MARGGGRGGGGGGRGGGSFGGSRGGGGRIGGSRGGGRRLGGGSSRSRGGGRSSSGGNSTSGSGGGYRGMGGFGRPFFGGYGGYGGYGYGRRRRGCGGGGGGCGCFSGIFILIALAAVFFMFRQSPNMGINTNTGVEDVSINPSTREREPIDPTLVTETEYYTDAIGDWIYDPVELEDGLKHFYDETNIQPYVYITDNINGEPNPNPTDIDAFADALYDELFEDEAHLLLVHFENYEFYEYEYSYHLVTGVNAKLVMDEEAENILFDYLDAYYHSDVTEDQLFSEAFKDTADRIMNVSNNASGNGFTDRVQEITEDQPNLIPIVGGAAVILVVLFLWWRRALKKPENNPNQESAPRNDKEKKDQFDDFDY